MTKNSFFYNDELDLIALVKIIWNYKIKLITITIVSLLVGFGYNYQLPDTYINSIEIKSSNQDEFIKILAINNLLNTRTTFYNKNNQNSQMKQFEMNQLILNKFIHELEDYEEFIFVIKDLKKIKKIISKFPVNDQEKKIFKYAKLLQIEPKKDDKNSYTLRLNWHDSEESIIILRDTINLTLKNLEKSIFKTMEEKLNIEKKKLLINNLTRIDFLKEQSLIAKKLGIKVSQINVDKTEKFYLSDENTSYYLRGYVAIDEEIRLLKRRNFRNIELIQQEIDIEKNKNFKWIRYNTYSVESKPLKKTELILIMSIILGLSIGILYVIISHLFKVNNNSKKRNN